MVLLVEAAQLHPWRVSTWASPGISKENFKTPSEDIAMGLKGRRDMLIARLIEFSLHQHGKLCDAKLRDWNGS